jgi:hypothetical protein
MRKHLLSSLLCLFVINLHAQTLMNKVPKDALFVARFAGASMTQKVSVEKMDQYKYVKENLAKLLHVDSAFMISKMGINFNGEAYQYYFKKDSSANIFATLVPLQDAKAFSSFIDSRNMVATEVHKNNFKYVHLNKNQFLGWNDSMVSIIVVLPIEKPYEYRYNQTDVDSAVAATTAVDSFKMTIDSFAIVKDEEVGYYPPPPPKGKKQAKKKGKKGTTTSKKKKKKLPVVDEEVYDEVREYPDETTYERNQRLKRQEEEEKKKQLASTNIAVGFFDNLFASSTTESSIANNAYYTKLIDSKSDMFIWFDVEKYQAESYDALMNGVLYRMIGGARYFHPEELMKNYGYKMGCNMFFEKETIHAQFKSISTDAETVSIFNELYTTKQSPQMIKHLNPNHLAYISSSLKSETLFKSYYSNVKSVINAFTGGADSAGNDVGSMVADISEILFDEKAFSDILPGNALFILHELKPKKVSYTTYEYDSAFNYKDVKKVKTELSPAFSAIFETKNEKIINKIFKVIKRLRQKDSTGITFANMGNAFDLFLGDSAFISHIYFQAKDGQFIFTTEKEQLNSPNYLVEKEIEQSILANSFSMQIDLKQIVEKVGNMELEKSVKSFQKYFFENLKKASIESAWKDGMMQSDLKFHIDGKHANSLEYLLNIAEYFFDTNEKEKNRANLTMLYK